MANQLSIIILFASAFFISLSTVTSRTGNLHPQPNPWWSKPISKDISTAGCLTQAQFEEAKLAGFKSIISMFNTDTDETIGPDEYPSTQSERAITERLGLKYAVILKPGEYDWMCLDTLKTFERVFPQLPKPVLFHCMSAYSASFISLLYYVNQTRHHVATVEDRVISLEAQGLLTQAAAMGFDYSLEEAPQQMLREISGKSDLEMDIKPDLTQPYWNFGFWHLKPIASNWFTLGSLKLNQLQALKDNDIDTVISLNPGPRQTPHTHVAKDGSKQGEKKGEVPKRDILNMECQDLDGENGSEISEEAERVAALKAGLQYIYAPLDSEGFSLSTWERIRPLVLTAGTHSKGLLLHGKSPRATIVVGLLAAGCQQNQGSAWALDRLRRHGYLQAKPLGGSTGGGEGEGREVEEEKEKEEESSLLGWLTSSEYLKPIMNTLGLDYLLTLSPSHQNKDHNVENLFKAVLDHREEMCKI